MIAGEMLQAGNFVRIQTLKN